MQTKTTISAILCVLALSLVGVCAGGVDAESTNCSVSYEMGGMTYTIQVENGGTCTLVTADELGAVPVGMTFVGWETPGGVLAPGSVITVTGDVTLVAKFAQTVYDIDFVSEGVRVGGATGTHGTAVPVPEIPVRDGWIFRGWSDGVTVWPADVPVMTCDETYTAVWSQDYSMIFRVGDLTVLETCVSEGVAPQDPSRVGFDFVGWSDGSGIVDPLTVVLQDDTVFDAVWRAAVYEVTFMVGDRVEAVQTVLHGGLAMEPAVQMIPRYSGWEWDFSTPITGDTVIRAAEAEVDNTSAYITIAVGVVLTLIGYGMYRAVKNGTIAINRNKGGE